MHLVECTGAMKHVPNFIVKNIGTTAFESKVFCKWALVRSSHSLHRYLTNGRLKTLRSDSFSGLVRLNLLYVNNYVNTGDLAKCCEVWFVLCYCFPRDVSLAF